MKNSQDSSTTTQVLDEGALVKVEGVSKKFCRSLKKSLWYGVQDLGREMTGKRNSGEEALRKDEFWAVKDVSFELKRGECIGIIGHNGAGKSTLLKVLNGLIKPDQGKVTMRGRVGALIELGAGFNPILTGRENIYINGQVLGFSRQEIHKKFDEIVEFAEIEEFIDMPVQNYSSGMRVRLGFSVAAQMEPDVLILDEVLAVGDIGFQIKCLNRIHELLQKTAFIFVSHSMPAVARVCSLGMLMDKGCSAFVSLDISQVIDAYHNAFNTGATVVMGSGEAEIQSILINGAQREAPSAVPFGGNIQIQMRVKINFNCKQLRARLSVWNQDQRPIFEVASENFQYFTWNNDTEEVLLTIDIEELRISRGKYVISVSIVDAETMRILCLIDNALSFVMGSYLPTSSAYYHPARWSIIRK